MQPVSHQAKGWGILTYTVATLVPGLTLPWLSSTHSWPLHTTLPTVALAVFIDHDTPFKPLPLLQQFAHTHNPPSWDKHTSFSCSRCRRAFYPYTLSAVSFSKSLTNCFRLVTRVPQELHLENLVTLRQIAMFSELLLPLKPLPLLTHLTVPSWILHSSSAAQPVSSQTRSPTGLHLHVCWQSLDKTVSLGCRRYKWFWNLFDKNCKGN